MKRFVKVLGALFLCLLFAVAGFYLWATIATNRVLARTFEVHAVDFPIPYPLAMADSTAMSTAMDEAIKRGRHLVSARYVCTECHGTDFGGGVMVDAFPIGRLLGPNITTGTGSRTLDYTVADWDRIVRHGIRPDGTPATMPSEDFKLMSDQELADVVAYIRSFPPVDEEVPPISLGPLGKVLLATGQLPLSADLISTHDLPHLAYPPTAEVSIEFGRHIASVCTGCHHADLAGGAIPGGDPSWAPSANLTPHEEGLEGWTYTDFAKAMTEGVRPDGTSLLAPMTLVLPYAQQMTEVELQALWTYLQSIPPVESGS